MILNALVGKTDQGDVNGHIEVQNSMHTHRLDIAMATSYSFVDVDYCTAVPGHGAWALGNYYQVCK